MEPRSVTELAVKGKKVFVRADYNVPLNESREITDDRRIRASLPTIQYLLKQGAALILAYLKRALVPTPPGPTRPGSPTGSGW